MNSMHKIITIFTLLFGSVFANAEGLSLGEPTYGGTGCPANSASVTLSPDQQELSIIFDNYVAEAGDSVGKKMDRKSCGLAIPVHVPQGFSIAIFQTDYRGFAMVPQQGRVQFTAESFFAGQRGSRFNKTIMGPTSDDFNLHDEFAAAAMVWSSCGDSVNLRVNTSLLAMTNRQMDQTYASVDSADVSSSLVYHLQWKRCR